MTPESRRSFDDRESPQSESYFPVPRGTIAAGVATGLDLFVRVAGRYVLYRSSEQPLDAAAVDKLLRRNIDEFHVHQAQADDFHQYLDRNLELLLDRAETRHEQASVLREAGHATLRTAFARFDEGESYERVNRVSKVTVERVVNDVSLVGDLVTFAEGTERLLTHAMNVTAYAVALASRRRELRDEDLYSLGVGAMVHDIGLTAHVPLLGHEDEWSEVERDIMARHPRRGYELLQRAGVHDPVVLDVALRHHDPASRGGSLAAQIVHIADTFDTLTTRTAEPDMTGPFAALYQMRSDVEAGYRTELLRDFIVLLGGVPVGDPRSPIAPLSRGTRRGADVA